MPKSLNPVGPRTVLLVDDEVDILNSLKSFLEMSIPGLSVKTAPSGEQGLSLLRQNHVDLIVSDYKMPQMNGLEFLKRAQEMYPNVPRVLITAFPKLDLAIEAINVVAVDKFLTKPINPDIMADVVRNLLLAKAA